MAERRFALRRIGAGDYLLPSNDGRTLWRLQRYEDGPSYGLDDWSRDRTFWRTLRWPESISRGTKLDQFDISNLGRWREVADLLSTRRAAIEIALRSDIEREGRDA